MFKKKKIQKNKKLKIEKIELENVKENQQQKEDNNLKEKFDVKIVKEFFGPQQNKKMEAPGIIDFNPSLCKDYYENGYCTWGSTCIYAHDRSNYKRGWELDKEWEVQQKLKQKEILENQLKNLEKKIEEEKQCSCCDQKVDVCVKASCGDIYNKKCLMKMLKNNVNFCSKCSKKISKIFSIN